MKILHIIPTYKPAYIYGGPVVVVELLVKELVELGHQITVYTTTANGKDELDVEINKKLQIDGAEVIYFNRITKDHTHTSPALWRYLDKTINDFDAVHVHSWWNISVLGVAWVCKRHHIKPVISPHGMFSNYILETNNSLKKRLIHNFIGKKLLSNSILHVSTEMELNESRAIIPGWKGMVIPNLVQLSVKQYERKQNDVFTIGFLSRVDPKKGLDLLIQALSKVNFNYILKVAGTGDELYMKSLKQLSIDCGNDSKIEWVGWLGIDKKFDFFSSLDLFALTSYSENFAIVIIEALSVGTPVLISNQVGLHQYVKENDYGWISTLNVDEITILLNDSHANGNKRQSLGSNLPALINYDYKPSVLAQQYIKLYEMAVIENAI